VFDPFPDADRAGFTIYRRVGAGFPVVEATHGDRVWSQRLDCFVRRIGEDADLRLRLARGPHGEHLVPTAEEAARATADTERAAKEAALRRIAELEAELAKRGRP
jgi:hypothetical protein